MTSAPLTVLLFVTLALAAGPAGAVYRCEINGRVEYRETPCPAGRQSVPKLLNDTPTLKDRRRAETEAALNKIEIERRELQEKLAYLKQQKCIQRERDVLWTEGRALKYKNDPWWQKEAMTLREQYELECHGRVIVH